MKRTFNSGDIVRHFKGNMYQILNLATQTETREVLVIYQALYGDYKIYARPLNMFIEKTDKIKYPDCSQEFRFEKIGNTFDCINKGNAYEY